MHFPEKLIRDANIRKFELFKGLAENSVKELLGLLPYVEYPAGSYLFRKGESDNQTFYLVSGQVAYVSNNKYVDVIEAGAESACYPLAHKQPRELSAKVLSDVGVICVNSDLLKTLQVRRKKLSYQVAEINVEKAEAPDWMTQVLQSRLLQQVPANNIMKIIQRLQKVTYKKGEFVVKQGDEGDFFYIMTSGRCLVARRSGDDQKPLKIAELKAGTSFGDEALISGLTRNASVSMLTEGSLYRLAKEDFNKYVRDSLLEYVGYRQATREVTKGAVWIDFREQDQFEEDALSGSINIPFLTLRGEFGSLEKKYRYIAYCQDGSVSAAAAFRMVESGYDVAVLKGGLNDLPKVTQPADIESPKIVEPETDSEFQLSQTDKDLLFNPEQSGDLIKGELVDALVKQMTMRNDSTSTVKVLEDDVNRIRGEREKYRNMLDQERMRYQIEVERYRNRVQSLESDRTKLNDQINIIGESSVDNPHEALKQTEIVSLSDEMKLIKKDLDMVYQYSKDEVKQLKKYIKDLHSNLENEKSMVQGIQRECNAEKLLVNHLQKERRTDRVLMAKMQKQFQAERSVIAKLQQSEKSSLNGDQIINSCQIKETKYDLKTAAEKHTHVSSDINIGGNWQFNPQLHAKATQASVGFFNRRLKPHQLFMRGIVAAFIILLMGGGFFTLGQKIGLFGQVLVKFPIKQNQQNYTPRSSHVAYVHQTHIN